LEAKPQSQLHAAFEGSGGISSEGWVRLCEIAQVIKLELRFGIYGGEVGVIENVIGFGAELEFEALAGHGNILEKRHIPIVDSRSSEVAPGTKIQSALGRAFESASHRRSEDKTIEVVGVGKGCSNVGYISRAQNNHAGSFGGTAPGGCAIAAIAGGANRAGCDWNASRQLISRQDTDVIERDGRGSATLESSDSRDSPIIQKSTDEAIIPKLAGLGKIVCPRSLEDMGMIVTGQAILPLVEGDILEDERSIENSTIFSIGKIKGS